MEVMPAMQQNTPNSDEIEIDEVMRLTGKSRDTIMRWKRDGKIKARTEMREFTQRQPRIVFSRSDIEALIGGEAESAGCGATVENHTTAGE